MALLCAHSLWFVGPFKEFYFLTSQHSESQIHGYPWSVRQNDESPAQNRLPWIHVKGTLRIRVAMQTHYSLQNASTSSLQDTFLLPRWLFGNRCLCLWNWGHVFETQHILIVNITSLRLILSHHSRPSSRGVQSSALEIQKPLLRSSPAARRLN